MQQPSNERLSQEGAAHRLPRPGRVPGGFTIDPKVIIAVVLFVTLGTLAVYIGFQTLPTPKTTVMEPMLGMTDSKMDSMPTAAASNMDSMTGVAASDPTVSAANNTSTLSDVRTYFRDHFSGQRYYSLISGYTVDQASLTIHTNIHGLDGEATQAGQGICGYANQLLKYGRTTIQQYEVWNQAGDRLCGSEP